MPDEKPNPLQDVVKGLGLLFRAAKTTLEQLPPFPEMGKLEEAVMTGAKEVGRAIENVAHTVEQQVRKQAGHGSHPPAQGTASAASPEATPPDPPADAPENVRVSDDTKDR